MSRSIQLLFPDDEMAEIEQLARREQVTVEEWIQRAIREAFHRRSGKSKQSKLEAVRRAAHYSFPSGGIHQIEKEEHG